ncbi:MAG TPA: ammonium transporter [Planctomycetota bacterium]|nr:ammonium transporter [Planctomycetota bacterium]
MRRLSSLCTALLLIAGASGLHADDEATPKTPVVAAEPAPPAAEPSEADLELAQVTSAAMAKDPQAEAKIAAATSWFGTYAKKKDKDGNDVPGSLETGISAGDNAWMLVACALVLLMTAPGLALFYGGLVRQKNVLGTMMQSFILMGIVTVIWTVFGFSMAFSSGNPFFGDFSTYAFLKGVVWDDVLATDANRYPISYDYAPTISFGVFAMFQLMFAIITPALITGAFAERMKFSAMVVFSVLWMVVVYLPMAHMVWGVDGFFNWWNAAATIPAFDFAGGTVVHISSGVAALMCALFLGKRRGYPNRPMPPHNLVLSFIGAALLWFGWFGFNGGSALGAGGLAVLAFANTQIAAAAAAVAWVVAEWLLRGKPTLLGGISGCVAGLVAITPACGFVTPGSALAIGAIAGFICFGSVTYLKRMLGYDDALDAFGIHGVGGIWGAIATGLFLNVDVNAAVPALTMFSGGSLYYGKIVAGEVNVVMNQIMAVLFTVVLSGVGSAVILLVVKLVLGLRTTADDEERGIDLTQHGEEAYNPAA